MASNLLDPKVLLHSRQRVPSEADTVVSANPPSSTDGTTAAPSVIDSLKQPCGPSPNLEATSDLPGNPSDYSPGQLNNLFPKSLDILRALGDLEALARGLHVDINAGLSVDEIGTDKAASPSKLLSSARSREAVLVMLLVAGSISLALGIYETVGVPQYPGNPTPVDWVEGVDILAAVVIVVLVASHNGWQKGKAFVKLNTRKENREVKVLRSGRSMLVNVHEVVFEDVLYLEPGDMVPVGGISISGHNVKCDESSATGESDALRETAGVEVFDIE
ncbi:E1-E2 ATPase-domain-containing protein [Aspergillus filifer]